MGNEKEQEKIDEELLAMGPDVVKEFDAKKEIRVVPPRRKTRLISIRLSVDMIEKLKRVASRRGDVGYQHIMKLYLADALEEDLHLEAKPTSPHGFIVATTSSQWGGDGVMSTPLTESRGDMDPLIRSRR